MPRIKEAEKEIIRQLGEYYAKNPDEVVSQKQIRTDLIERGIKADSATIRICLQVGIMRALGAKRPAEVKRALQVYSELWPKPETKPEFQEIVRQKGKQFALHPETVQSIKQIRRELVSQGRRISTETLRDLLREGIARVASSPEMVDKIYRKLWPRRETSPEVQELLQQKGEYYVRNPQEAKPIKEIRRKLAEQNHKVSPTIIRRHLREGAIRALGQEQGLKTFHNLWPKSETPAKVQEDIRRRGEFHTRELIESQKNKTEPNPVPQIRKIKQEFADQGIILNDKTVAKYLRQGVCRVVSPEQVAETFYKLWPKSKAPPEILEEICQKGEYYAQHREEVLSIYHIRHELEAQGKHVDFATISTQLKEGVKRVVGPERVTEVYQELWPQTKHHSPEVREAICQKGGVLCPTSWKCSVFWYDTEGDTEGIC